MIVQYCDVCGSPLKANNFYTLYACPPDENQPDPNKYPSNEEYYKDYVRYLSRLQNETKEICPSCKHIFDKIFEYRLQGMSKLTEECEDLFNLPPKQDKKKKDKDGNK